MATRRGLSLEPEILKVISARRHIKINQCGLYVNRQFPVFGASPDGITNKYVIEVKCPSKEKSILNYIKNGKIVPKCNAQMQLQMLFTKRRKGLFCVADHRFETTKDVTIIDVNFDSDLCDDLLRDAGLFWEKNIFPVL